MARRTDPEPLLPLLEPLPRFEPLPLPLSTRFTGAGAHQSWHHRPSAGRAVANACHHRAASTTR